MHLYEINAEIALLLQQLEVDPETGEILASSEDIIRQLDTLGMERSRILEYLAKVVIETRAEAIVSTEANDMKKSNAVNA